MTKKKLNTGLPGAGGSESFSPLKPSGEPLEGRKKGRYKRSEHLTNQMLKYTSQPSLFDNLKEDTINKIEVSGVELTQVAEGINLTPTETKLVDSLCKLLEENSQNLDPKESNYYAGNKEMELMLFEGEKTVLPKLGFTLYELTKEYKGGGKVTGKDVQNVSTALQNLAEKQFLMKYKETAFKKGGGRIEKEIEVYEKIIKLPKFKQREYDREGVELSKTEETLIILHPIFRRQIDTFFIPYPNDIIKRTQDAYGSNFLSRAAVRLRDWLMKELKYKHYKPDMGLYKLLSFVSREEIERSDKKRAKDNLDKALDTCIKLELLESYEIATGKNGESKVIFHLNKDWE